MGIFSNDKKGTAGGGPETDNAPPLFPNTPPATEPVGPESFGGSDYASRPDDDNGGPAGWTPREEGARAQAHAESVEGAFHANKWSGMTERYETDGTNAPDGLKAGKAKLRWSLLPW